MHLLLYVQCSTPFPLPYLLSLKPYFVSMVISLFYAFGGPEKDLDLNYTHCFFRSEPFFRSVPFLGCAFLGCASFMVCLFRVCLF